MTNYTYSQLVTIAERGGFPPRYAGVAAAIALAESGGNPSATNHNTNGSTDYGLWQINSVHGVDPNWKDPVRNAQIAYSLFHASGWHPWTTYNDGAYKAHLNGAHVVAANTPRAYVSGNVQAGSVPAGGTTVQNASLLSDLGSAGKDAGKAFGYVNPLAGLVTGADGGAIAGLSSSVDILKAVVSAVFNPYTWERIGIGAIGFFMILIAFFLMVESNKTVRQATTKAAEVAAIA